jgi:hypothetical protein
MVPQSQVSVAVDGLQVCGDQTGVLLGVVDVIGPFGEASLQQAGELLGYLGENVVLGRSRAVSSMTGGVLARYAAEGIRTFLVTYRVIP